MDDVHMEANVHRQSNGEENKKNFTHVRALHNFCCSNNDELYLKKDDVRNLILILLYTLLFIYLNLLFFNILS